jgi:acyl carrier protein
MTLDEKMKLIAEVLESDDELTPDMLLADQEGWDSLSKLSLIVAMDDNFGKRLTGMQIREFKTIRDILDFME